MRRVALMRITSLVIREIFARGLDVRECRKKELGIDLEDVGKDSTYSPRSMNSAHSSLPPPLLFFLPLSPPLK